MKGIKFQKQIQIRSSQELIFDLTQNYDQRLKWDTFLTKAELMDGAKVADVGVKAYCVAKNTLGMVTEYVSYNRPKVTAIKMTKGPFLFSTFLGSWNFKSINKEETEVSFLYSATLRFPFNLVQTLIQRNLERNVNQRLVDLKAYAEQST